ncbi:DUF6476 family protein [Planktotalea arctica]|uniref:DUF6476 family protein n=1 Tax=Planktotalea arctica TaxID=1481893 RepID=UPI000BAA1FF0|nr:DUF6476 family protein [Planktotalea arctica]
MLPPEQEIEEPAQLRFLRRLVTVLTAVMIGGVLLIITLLVIRLNDKPALLPELVVLPEGIEAKAVTMGESWYAIVTQSDEILIYDRLTGKLRQRVEILGDN